MYHFFFIHSFVNGCLGCFLVLAIVNSAAVTIEMHVFFFFNVFVFCGYIPRSGIAGSCSSYIFFFFEGNILLFSVVAALIYIPTSSIQDVSCLNILTNICYL